MPLATQVCKLDASDAQGIKSLPEPRMAANGWDLIPSHVECCREAELWLGLGGAALRAAEAFPH